ncbi:MAG TPA: hypothetical protein V6C76_02435 [Drouetiella sp.]
MRNDSNANVVAVQTMTDALQELQHTLREAEKNYGLQSGEAGMALLKLVEYLEGQPGNEEIVKRLNERIEEIYQIYLDACEE